MCMCVRASVCALVCVCAPARAHKCGREWEGGVDGVDGVHACMEEVGRLLQAHSLLELAPAGAAALCLRTCAWSWMRVMRSMLGEKESVSVLRMVRGAS